MRVRTAVAQLNQHVGDYKKNTDKILGAIEYAVGKKADIIIFPELSLNGYPLEDLILKT
ncbi:MAG TPA: nitrilase-related carbon-nitrogen hydrolase, partial [Petrotogaceae bacterium]|nr:nitrilase-related carbon-nitrogen hydrolase [Petrotogaceae bacterium]